jgi:hypothetical protein
MIRFFYVDSINFFLIFEKYFLKNNKIKNGRPAREQSVNRMTIVFMTLIMIDKF